MFNVRAWGSAALAAAFLFASPAGGRAETGAVKIGLQYGLVYLPIVVAAEEKLFEKNAKALGLPGLDVALSRISGSTGMNDALLSGSIEAGALGSAGALIAWDKTRGKQQIKSIAGLSVVTYTLFTNRQNVSTLKDFTPNDKIAVPAFNSPQAILLRVAAERDLGGQDKANALMTALPHPDATAALLAGEAIGGYFATPPFSQIIERDPRMRKVLVSGSLFGGQEATAATLAATQQFVDANPKVAEALLRGLADACALIRADPKKAAEIYLKSEAVQLSAADVEKITTDGSIVYQIEPQGMMTYTKYMYQQGLLKKEPQKWQDLFFPMIGDRSGS
ncbi:ABC transporter substrate-binding protein [Xanthobacter autotrophicus]|uniref:ABC transporter substrate-binding protein n=1 Tax=Xanthobacter autotrophicus TaxID=280 RepID=UPI0037290369